MKKRTLSILLIMVMAVCFGVAASYPIKYFLQKESNETDMADLRAMRMSALEDNADMDQTAAEPTDASPEAGTETPVTGGSVSTDAAVGGSADISYEEMPTISPDIFIDSEIAQATYSETVEEPVATEEPIDRYADEGYVLPYSGKELVQFTEEAVLPQYSEIYELNNDLVGWLNIPDTIIDYPVVRNDDPDYYLDRDFYGEPNSNGQLILDSACDPWTPSYNLVISGHNMKSGKMFAPLINYTSKGFWEKHKTLTFDTVLREGTYVVFAAFYSADYAEDEEGFRYNADVQYRLDAELWLADIMENCEYDTGIDVEFGDEFLTLTTCQYHREDGRFVVVARRIREGEVIE